MKPPNRSLGHRSPLDKLPEDVRRELAQRCRSGETLRAIAGWLADGHSVKISKTSISDWWRRRVAAGTDQTETWNAAAPGFGITVTAPGAESITVRLHPQPLTAAGDEKS